MTRKPYYYSACPVCNLDYEGPRHFMEGCWCSKGCDSPDCVAAMADEAYERATASAEPAEVDG